MLFLVTPIRNAATSSATQAVAYAASVNFDYKTLPKAQYINPHEQLMADAGIKQSDWPYAEYIISHESGFCATKWENEIGYCPSKYTSFYSVYDDTKGYGLCMSTPAIKMQSVDADWRGDAVTQLKWCSIHAEAYGGWKKSYEFWVAHKWW